MARVRHVAGLVSGLLAMLWAGTATAQVSVRFVSPDRYTDAENRLGSGFSLRVTLGEIRRILEIDGSRALHPGELLVLDVLDVDLAGFEMPGANVPFGLRVVRDGTPPRFRLRYSLTNGRRLLLSGEETVTDLNFLLRNPRFSNGTFDHERNLLRDWLQRRIGERRPA